ncbi:MAG: prepilin-type N-terminal cleavage/methylation domain-containing protein [Nitrospirae bacterium]|nr:MAG: prepilin-type N-terminal cleavage/methylation domain-containing protein [Nitrospirota bacterium]
MTVRQAGFTLLELVVALAISLLTVATAYSVYVSQARSMAAHRERLAMQQELRAISDLMVRELRQAGYDPAGVNHDADPTNDFVGVSGDADNLVIRADLNGDGQTDDSHEQVSFSYDPNAFTLRRDTGGGRQPFGEAIESFEVRLFDRNGHMTLMPARVRYVQVVLVGRTTKSALRSAAHDGNQTYPLRVSVAPRNLGLGR